MYLIILFCVVFQEKGVEASEAERILIHYLFKESRYDNTIRPVEYSHQPVNVTFNLALFQLFEMNEKEQVIELSVWVRQMWTDSQLTWNPNDYDNITEFNIRPDKLWLPDIVLYNNVADDVAEYGGNMDTLKTRVIVYSTGTVYWLAPLIIKASCKIIVQEFPFDTQHCLLTFGSWTYDTSRLDINTTGVDTDKYKQNLEWNLVKAEGNRNQAQYNCCAGVWYADVTFHLHFQRRSLFYVLHLIFPIALMTLLTIVIFILPAESGERLSMGVTLLLAVTVFMLLVAEMTPETSEGIPMVTVYFVLCMVLMFIMIVLLCYISRLYNRRRTDRPMDKWTRRFIFDKLSYIVRIRVPHAQHEHGGDNSSKNVETDDCFTTNTVELKNNGHVIRHNTSDGGNYINESFIGGDKLVDSPRLSVLKRLSKSSSMDSDDARQLEFVIKEFERNERHKHDGDHHHHHGDDGDKKECYTFEEEWRVVGMTIDRCLFITFIIIFIGGTIACFSNTTYVK